MSKPVLIALMPFIALAGCVADEDGEQIDIEIDAEAADAQPDADAPDGPTIDAVDELKAEQDVSEAGELPAALLVSSAEKWDYLVQPGKYPYVAGPCKVPYPDWTKPDFYPDDSWAKGLAELGYGDGDEQTVINAGPSSDYKCITQYFRHEFDAYEATRFKSLILRLLVDDGAVVYLNGYEIARYNLPYGPIYPETPAKSAVSGSAESKYVEFKLPAEYLPYLYEHGNVLAVEVHQYSKKDGDLSFNAELLGALDAYDPYIKTFSFASMEATIDESRPYVRLGGDYACKADGASGEQNYDKQKEQVCLTQWDLTAYDVYYKQIPPYAKVLAAHVKTKVVNTSPRSYQLFPVVTPWLEPKVTWSDPDGDLYGEWYSGQFSPADLESYPVSSVNALYTGTRIIPLPAWLVQQWIDDPDSNNGLAILNFLHVDGIDFSATGNGLELVLALEEKYPAPL